MKVRSYLNVRGDTQNDAVRKGAILRSLSDEFVQLTCVQSNLAFNEGVIRQLEIDAGSRLW